MPADQLDIRDAVRHEVMFQCPEGTGIPAAPLVERDHMPFGEVEEVKVLLIHSRARAAVKVNDRRQVPASAVVDGELLPIACLQVKICMVNHDCASLSAQSISSGSSAPSSSSADEIGISRLKKVNVPTASFFPSSPVIVTK